MTPEPWNGPAAVALMIASDDEVERCGCVGTHPTVQVAVLQLADAYQRRDTAGVRAGCEAVVLAARKLALVRHTPGA